MKRHRREIVLIALTVLAVSAGVVAGLVAARKSSASATSVDTQPAGLAQELNLTGAQAEAMRKIWENVREQTRRSFEGAQTLQNQRDADIFAMLTDEQKKQFEGLTKKYADQFVKLRKERDQTFGRAVDQTRKLLNDEQRRKYDALLEKHVRPDQFGLPGAAGHEPPAAFPPATDAIPPSSTRSP